MGLNTQLMIVNLTIRKWAGTKLDKTVSSETNMKYNVKNKAARVYKNLLPKSALEKTRKAYNAVYTYHYANTLPWGDAGRRVLPAKHYFKYSEKMRELINVADREVNEFLRNYASAVAKAQTVLNDMFDPADYPEPAEIASHFGIKIDLEPLPDAGDFRVDLVQEEVDKIREQIAEQQNEMANQAMRDLWNRTYKVVQNMAERLGNEKNVFRNSLVGNVVDIVSLLPKMNVTGDKELTKLCHEMEEKLVKYDAVELRNDNIARKETAQAANDILDMMSGFTGGAQ